MKILIVGNGGREHTLLWKIRRDAPDAELFITRGNGGTADLATSIPIDPGEIQALAGWAEHQGVDLTVVGPEGPLDAGVGDHFAARGLAVFGPTRAAARIESSKAFAKGLMERNGVPTAAYRTFRELPKAEKYIRDADHALVVKASGLAAGKGAVVCDSKEEALVAARGMLSGDAFGGAGREIVVEERMEGEELSVFALTDGEHSLILPALQDHKRIGEGETGPNTGGMGAYAPVSIATPELMERVERDIISPTLAALRREKSRFRGLLYTGLMLTESGPRVVEFNCRFGDPETQALLPLLDGSLLEPIRTVAAGGSLRGTSIAVRPGAAATTVLASEGYPGSYPKGREVDIPGDLSDDPDIFVFHAGTTLRDGRLVTSGGRVLAVTALGDSVRTAAERSRAAAERITFEGRQLRRDIGWREVERGEGRGAGGEG